MAARNESPVETIRHLEAENEHLRAALVDLLDALHDELAYEVNNTPHVLAHIRKTGALLHGPEGGYPQEGWW